MNSNIFLLLSFIFPVSVIYFSGSNSAQNVKLTFYNLLSNEKLQFNIVAKNMTKRL